MRSQNCLQKWECDEIDRGTLQETLVICSKGEEDKQTEDEREKRIKKQAKLNFQL
jgi:hypothetical protein